MTFTDYQSAVLRVVEITKNVEDYVKLPCFQISTITNIIADNWKDRIPFKVTAEDVAAYIKTLEK